MPHVSSKELDKGVFDKIFWELISTLEKAQRKSRFVPVFKELLTNTERVMLAKRLAIILLLASGIPQHRIAQVLLVSPSTVARVSLNLELGLYDSIIKVSRKEKVNLERLVWLLLTAGGILPPRTGRKYWLKRGFKSYLER